MTLRTAATRGWKVSMVSSWKEDTSATISPSTAKLSAWAASGVPMLPATSTGRGCSDSSAPVSAVVVVLPLVPVMAMVSPSIARQPSSSSPISGRPRSRAGASCGPSQRHAGAHHDQVGALEGGGVGAGVEAHAGGGQRRHLVPELIEGPGVHPRHVGADVTEQPRRRDPTLGQPHDRHATPGQRCQPRAAARPRRSPPEQSSARLTLGFDPHRDDHAALSVLTAALCVLTAALSVLTAASMWSAPAAPAANETIQKRTMIFGSGQPAQLEVVVHRRHPEDRRPVILNEATWTITEAPRPGRRRG